MELQSALREQVNQLGATPGQQHRAARLSQFLENSIQKVEEMSSGGRPPTPATTTTTTAKTFGTELEGFSAKAGDDRSGDDTDGLSAGSDLVSKIEVDDARSIHSIDPLVLFNFLSSLLAPLLSCGSLICLVYLVCT